MAYFYLAPSQQRFEAFQNRAENLRGQLKGAGNGADLLVAVMIARISAAHGWPIADRGFGNVAKEVLEGQSPFARYVADDSAVDPTKLDVWWASFFATGDDRYLDNIFRYAGLELPEHDLGLTLVIGAATWSFKANSRQHQRVLDFGKRKLGSPSLSEPQTTFLKECIAYAQAEGEAERQAPPGPRKVARP